MCCAIAFPPQSVRDVRHLLRKGLAAAEAILVIFWPGRPFYYTRQGSLSPSSSWEVRARKTSSALLVAPSSSPSREEVKTRRESKEGVCNGPKALAGKNRAHKNPENCSGRESFFPYYYSVEAGVSDCKSILQLPLHLFHHLFRFRLPSLLLASCRPTGGGNTCRWV